MDIRPDTGGNLMSSAKRKVKKKQPRKYSRLFSFSFGKDLLLFFILDALISCLFYRSVIAFACLLPSFPLYVKVRKAEWNEVRRRVMRSQFLSALQHICISLQAGHVPENAFPEALDELRRMYPPDAPIIEAFERLCAGLELNLPLEQLLSKMAQQSGVDDIQSFAEVFRTARRSGGDMIRIVRSTTEAIRKKEETLREIESVLAGKQLEQRMMSMIPLFILAYVSVTSPGFLDVMYHNAAGILIMTLCLLLYVTAFLWGRKIMRIRV